MDCPRCNYVLEHPDRALAESELWTDLPECCQESLRLVRLERGLHRMLPTIEPSPSLDEAILVAARKHAKPAAAAAMPLEPVATSGVSWVARLRRWVTAPQVAMATITALAVVIGIFYVPSRERFLEAEGDTVMPVAQQASPAVADEGSEPPPSAAAPTAPMATASAKPPMPASNSAEATALLRAAERGALAGRAQAPDELAQAEADQPSRSATELGSAERREAADEEVSMEAYRRVDTAATSGGGTADRLASRAAAPAAPAAPAPAPMPSVSRSVVAAEAEGAANSPGSVDLLSQARSARSRGQCAAAIPLYDRYLAESTVGPRAEATMELAGCLAQTGRTDRARQLYSRATSYPSVANAARQQLAELDRAVASRSGSSAPATAARARASGAGAAADVAEPAAGAGPSH